MKLSKYNVWVQEDGLFYVCNTVTGAILEMTEDEYILINHSSNNINKEWQQELTDGGVLVDDEISETALLRSIYQKSKVSKKVARFTICPTLECNFSCGYCYQRHIKGVMPKPVQDACVEYIEKTLIQGIEEIVVTFFGGEPLLYPDIIKSLAKKISEACRKHGTKCTFLMITNGYYLDENTIQMLLELPISGMQITLDGTKEIEQKKFMIKDENLLQARELLIQLSVE